MRSRQLTLILTLAIGCSVAQTAMSAPVCVLQQAQSESQEAVQLIDARTAAGGAKLIFILGDSQHSTEARVTAIESLAEAQCHWEVCRQAMLNQISKDSDMRVCVAAINSLNDLGVSADAALPKLRAALKDKRGYLSVRGCSFISVRSAACRALATYGPAAVAAMPDLVAVMPDHSVSSDLVKGGIRHTLGKVAPETYPLFVQGESAIPLLVARLSSSNGTERMEAAQRLRVLRQYAQSAVSALEIGLKDSEPKVRLACATALLTMQKHQGAADLLIAEVGDAAENATQWTDVLRSLRKRHDRYDSDKLEVGLLHSSDPSLAYHGACRLAQKAAYANEAFDAMMVLYDSKELESQYYAVIAFKAFPEEMLRPYVLDFVEATKRDDKVGRVAKHLVRNKFPELALRIE